MIQHQIQGRNECLAASIAMLSGKSLSEVTKWGIQFRNTTPNVKKVRKWQLIVLQGDWPTAMATMDHFLGVGFGLKHHDGLRHARMAGTMSGITFPENGRGIITV